MNEARRFLSYLSQITRHGVALALGGLGALAEIVRLSGQDIPIPRWIDVALFMSGLAWGGYVVYRDKEFQAPENVPRGPTPLSAFHSSLSSLPRHLPMAEVVVGYELKHELRFTEDEFDSIDGWLESLIPQSVPARTDMSFIRRQQEVDNVLLWHAQVMPPGPALSLDKVIEVRAATEGVAADFEGIYEYWTLLCDELPKLSTKLSGDPARIAVALQPYPADTEAIVDLWFARVQRPPSTGATGMVPPWQEIYELDSRQDLAQVPERAARDLLRHFGFRDFDETIRQLLEIRAER
jgi:hypothetical protein